MYLKVVFPFTNSRILIVLSNDYMNDNTEMLAESIGGYMKTVIFLPLIGVYLKVWITIAGNFGQTKIKF